MFTMALLAILALAYIVLKTLNMRARFAEEDARRAAEEEAARLAAEEEAEEEAEEDRIRAEAIDVDAEVVEPGTVFVDFDQEGREGSEIS